MIPKLIDNARSVQLDLLDRAGQAHAMGGRAGIHAISDAKKDADEEREERRDRYEHEPAPDETSVDFSETLKQARFVSGAETAAHPGQLPLPGMDFSLRPNRSPVPGNGRGVRLDLEA